MNRFLKRVRDLAQVEADNHITADIALEGLRRMGVDEHGLTRVDRLILESIAHAGGTPVGLKTLAAAVGEDERTLEDVYEPHLLRDGVGDEDAPGSPAHPAGSRAVGHPAPGRRPGSAAAVTRTATRPLRTACFALALLLGGLLPACGDAYDLPALAGGEAPQIRVLLGGRKRRQATLRIVGQGWTVTSEGGQTFTRRGRGSVNALVRAGARGIAIGPDDTGATVLRIRPDRSFELEGVHYAGDLLLHREEDRVRFVNELDLETYVAGVIPNEMAPQATAAAYRAQAVAARTYGWIRLSASDAGARTWHVTDDQASQVYTGLDPRYDVPYAPMVEHARSTSGVVLTWQNQPFPAYYSSTCGGHTTDAAYVAARPGGATVSAPRRALRLLRHVAAVLVDEDGPRRGRRRRA